MGAVPPSEVESQLLYEIPSDWKASGQQIGLSDLEMFVEAFPNSPWGPSLRVNLGAYYRSRGRNSAALEHWLAAWEIAKDFRMAMANAWRTLRWPISR